MRRFLERFFESDPPKIKGGVMRARAFDLLEQAIEDGVACGWRRAHKHSDNPDEDLVRANIEREVLNMICERFEFE